MLSLETFSAFLENTAVLLLLGNILKCVKNQHDCTVIFHLILGLKGTKSLAQKRIPEKDITSLLGCPPTFLKERMHKSGTNIF